MPKIQIDLARDDSGTIAELLGLGDLCSVAQPDHFEGSLEIVSAIVSVTTASVPILSKIIRAHIASKKHIKVKMKGVEISGASLKDVAKFLNEIKSDE